MTIKYGDKKDFPLDALIRLYRSVHWSSAEKPLILQRSLAESHSVVSAWVEGQLIGLGNTISDGHLVVYYSHLLVMTEWQGKGVGSQILKRLMKRYAGFHQQVLLADGDAVGFFTRHGFVQAGRTKSMWIYQGDDH